MYASFFGLKQEPFSIAPDPRYLFMSERHREALAHLLYGLRGGGGFVLLTGEIGAGKTTVCRCFLEQIPKRCNVAYIFNPKLTVQELLSTVCQEFRIPCERPGAAPPSLKDHVDALNGFLLRTHAVGQNNVLIIDEAQNLSPDVLEQLRLLTNLETSERKLLQIVLIGQPELRGMLARPELEQLAQRVIARYHLQALSPAETEQYIRHRMGVGGLTAALPFDARALRRIHKLTGGVPRRINLLCDRALLGAYAGGKSTVDQHIVDHAAEEVFDRSPPPTRALPPGSPAPRKGRSAAWGLGLGVAAGAAFFGVVALALDSGLRKPAPAAPKAAQASAAGMGARPASGSLPPPAVGPQAAASTAAYFSGPQGPAAPAAAGSGPAAAATTVASAGTSASTAPAPAMEPIASETSAWRELAGTWNLSFAEGEPCAQAQRQHLQCFRSNTSSLAQIRQLDRPGILTLHGVAGDKPGYAVLVGLSDSAAVLRMGGASRSVPLSSLAAWWRGDYATFWRAPAGYPGKATRNGDQTWLASAFARLPGGGSGAERKLPARVAAFQLTQGLKPDGLAGPITLMQLNRATGVDEPRLQSPR